MRGIWEEARPELVESVPEHLTTREVSHGWPGRQSSRPRMQGLSSGLARRLSQPTTENSTKSTLALQEQP